MRSKQISMGIHGHRDHVSAEGKVKVYVDGRNTNTKNWVILQNPEVNRRKIKINPEIYIAY
jgi:hypothetical protein